ncbi:phytoene/squalene synthase family protein [Nemorincola caseinilytica]|uniref:Phytoene/squalene synthase family protein n=1 Tax=Nemorincola caseinilytica TaxID=2054315 RepID=A0ABP8NNU2_9BACT
MKELFDKVSAACSVHTTNTYSTSFSSGIRFLHRDLREPIYGIYGFVRFADEIVDSFHGHDKATLLTEFRADTWKAIERGISVNPILNSFQHVVRTYGIERDLIECFFDSMETDLHTTVHTAASYSQYILGSAEVVGLMCLRVFVDNDNAAYESLRPAAMKLGAAFQKVNFLRDIRADNQDLGRTYFPGVDLGRLSEEEKMAIQADIEADLKEALLGIRRLPLKARSGVYLAYYYYMSLYMRIKKMPAKAIMTKRVRIPDLQKLGLVFTSMVRLQLNIL